MLYALPFSWWISQQQQSWNLFSLLLRTESTTSCDQKGNEHHLNTACCLFTKPLVNRLCTSSLKEGSVPSLCGSTPCSGYVVPSARSVLSGPCFSPGTNGDSLTSALKLKLSKGSQTETLRTDPPGYPSLLQLPKNSPLEGNEAFRVCSFFFQPVLKRLPHP